MNTDSSQDPDIPPQRAIRRRLPSAVMPPGSPISLRLRLTNLYRNYEVAFPCALPNVRQVQEMDAVQWADVVRAFNAPTILFAATPFRNDLKMFHVDMEHAFFLSVREAVARRIIRDVHIAEIVSGDAQIFARNLVPLRDELIRAGRYPSDSRGRHPAAAGSGGGIRRWRLLQPASGPCFSTSAPSARRPSRRGCAISGRF